MHILENLIDKRTKKEKKNQSPILPALAMNTHKFIPKGDEKKS